MLTGVTGAQTLDPSRNAAEAAATHAGALVDGPPARFMVAQAGPAPGAPGPARVTPDQPPARAGITGLASPPTALETGGAIAGALLAIVLAIAGVTLTFRSMREEMRRGRGRSRRSARNNTAMTPQG